MMTWVSGSSLRIQMWGYQSSPAEELHRLERSIAEAVGSRVLLVAGAAGIQVYSYRYE